MLSRLRFADPALERAFLEDDAARMRPTFRYLHVGACLLWILSAILDTTMMGDRGRLVAIEVVRLGVAFPIALLPVAVSFAAPERFMRWWRPAGAVAGFGVCVCIAVAMRLTPGASSGTQDRFLMGYGLMGVLAVIIAEHAALNRFAPASVATWLGALAFLIAEWGAVPAMRIYMAFFLASWNVFGGIISYSGEVTRREIFEQRHLLALERARTERLLKREISHQVAARSKKLGEELALLDEADGALLSPGDSFDGRYRVIGALGAGGMGAVYEVVRQTDDERFALKVLTGRVSGAVAARFAREAEIGARLQHPNLVSIVDVGVTPSGSPFLVMELVRGGSLEDHRARFGDAAWARPLLIQIADGLVALHEAGVVHRDLKPGNVLMAEPGGVAKISDFGISRQGDSRAAISADEVSMEAVTLDARTEDRARLTGTGVLLGTPLYMAPEAAGGARAAGGAADVFAFAILAYETLTGLTPFDVPPVMLAIAKQPIPPPRALPGSDALSRCLADCLQVDPAARPTMRDVRRSLG